MSIINTTDGQNTVRCAATTSTKRCYILFISLVLTIIWLLRGQKMSITTTYSNVKRDLPTNAKQKAAKALNAPTATSQEIVSSTKLEFFNLSSIISPTVPPRAHTHIVPGTNYCWRECPFGRNNKIIYTNSGRAGMSDRQSIISAMTNLAGYLCAYLEFPLPKAILHPKHNGNKVVSSALVWDDFLVVTAVKDPYVTSKQEPPLSLLQDIKNDPNKSQKYSNEQWIKVVSSNASTVVDEFDLVYSIITANENTKYFVWFFDLNWYKVRDSLAKHFKSMNLLNPPSICTLQQTPTPPTSCIYGRTKTSPRAKAISDYLWNALVTMETYNSTRNATMGFLHIRRTDTIKQCNTTLNRIRAYLHCSLKDVTGNVTLLLGTDETDPNYIAAIQNFVENKLGGGHKLIHLDAWISRQLEMMAIQKKYSTSNLNALTVPVTYLNNYHVYLFGKSISSNAAFKLEQRKGINCNDCDPVVL